LVAPELFDQYALDRFVEDLKIKVNFLQQRQNLGDLQGTQTAVPRK
jgi:hypothetical protein